MVERHRFNHGLRHMAEYPKHYCGVFGAFGLPNAAELTYYGLYALQHRGQESAGIVSCEDGAFFESKGMGLVSAIFDEVGIEGLRGSMAIGHTRYSTTGSSLAANAQPMTIDCAKGKIAIAHNGNLTNAAALRTELEGKGSIFSTSVDSEIILHLMAQPHLPGSESPAALAMRRIEGAYSLVMMTENELIGVRDPHGFRPLSIGKLEDGWVLSSETCAFDLIGAENVREVEPGEMVIISANGIESIPLFSDHDSRAFCVFEYVYFARPDSVIGSRSVYRARVEMGRQLAKENRIEADLVAPIPDGGNCAALGYSLESGIPYEMAFVRNHYVGRSFIQPTQAVREISVRVKLNLIRELVAGKRVVVVDDSIVRGTTCRKRVRNLKEAGAKEVHVLVSCPPTRHPCYYGIDFPDRSKLLAYEKSTAEIAQILEADSVNYLSVEGMVAATGQEGSNLCLACFTGDYPVAFDEKFDKVHAENRQMGESTPRFIDELRGGKDQLSLL